MNFLQQLLSGFRQDQSSPNYLPQGPSNVPRPKPVHLVTPRRADPVQPMTGQQPFSREALRNWVRAFAAGASAPNPNPRSLASSIGAGLAGSTGYRSHLESLRAEQQALAEQQAYDRSRDALKDDLARNRDRRESRSAGFRDLSTAADIRKTNREIRRLGDENGLTFDDMMAIERRVMDYAETLKGDLESIGEDKEPKVDAYRQRLMDQARAMKSGPRQPAPETLPTREAPLLDPGQVSGEGTQEQPFTGIADRAGIEALPAGAFFIWNGVIHQRR